MQQKEPLKFSELGAAAQERFFEHARLLLEKGYVTDTVSRDDLAARIYESQIRHKLGLQPLDQPSNDSFLSYDKDSVWSVSNEKDNKDWLK